MNGLISETDSLVKALISTLDENMHGSPAFLNNACNLVQNLLGFLVLVPSNPEISYFQLAEGVINIAKNEFWESQPKMKAKIYVALINYLMTQVQDALPYHIYGVESNDTIFTGNEDFQKEAD